jgi:hypothetical protein
MATRATTRQTPPSPYSFREFQICAEHNSIFFKAHPQAQRKHLYSARRKRGVEDEKFLFLGTGEGDFLKGQFREKFVLNFKATQYIFSKIFGGSIF